jgi:biotin carboxyl carrier protein
MPAKKSPDKKAEESVKKEAKKAEAKKKIEDKVTAEKIEAKKAATKATRKTKTAKAEIVIQSPMGGNITTEEILAKIPAGADTIFVRVDQNKLWWTKGEETGSVDIW